MKQVKTFIVIALSVLVVGFAFLGFFGFNQSVDYSTAYELNISIDQKADGATEILETSVESYLEEKGLVASAPKQVVDEGLGLIYKFDKDVSASVTDIETVVKAALAAANITVVDVVAEVSLVSGEKTFGDWNILYAIGIAIVVTFLYTLIMNKLAGALATLGSSLISVILFVALVALTRIPANPFVAIGALFASVVGASLSISTVGRYKEEENNVANEKLSASELVEKLFAVEKKKYILVLASLVVIALAFAVTMACQFLVLGGQIVLLAIASTAAAYFGTPIIWSAIKNQKK